MSRGHAASYCQPAFDRRSAAFPVVLFDEAPLELTKVRILPGEHHVTDDPGRTIVTVLGSCVSACIRDYAAEVGGMNHFMLPQSESGDWGEATASLRYENFAMERLINDILARGGRRNSLEIKVFGGANVLQNGSNIGWLNAQFVEGYLAAERLPIAARHLYGIYPRRIHYVPSTGKVSMLELRRQSDLVVVETEESYGQMLKKMPLDGSTELFDTGKPL
jgi:chemotaxis protein CheD